MFDEQIKLIKLSTIKYTLNWTTNKCINKLKLS